MSNKSFVVMKLPKSFLNDGKNAQKYMPMGIYHHHKKAGINLANWLDRWINIDIHFQHNNALLCIIIPANVNIIAWPDFGILKLLFHWILYFVIVFFKGDLKT